MSWTYSPAPGGLFSECGTWQGEGAPALRPHFHAEAQFTVVTAGRRAFRVGSRLHVVEAGQCLYIPAGVVHQSLPALHLGSHCLNAYARGAGLGPQPLTIPLPAFLLPPSGRRDPAVLLAAIEAQLAGWWEPLRAGTPVPAAGEALATGRPIRAAAAAEGVSREHFSRRFARQAGVAPQTWRIIRRLNEARRRLRLDEPIAGLAADLGFADQSHLGRLFRQAFGVTPLGYRNGMR